MKLLQELDRRILPPVGNVLARLFRGAVRLRVFTAVVGVVAVTATLLVVHDANRHRRSDPSLGDVLRVGVPEGASIPGYLDSSRAELAGLAGDTAVYALVSFNAYLAPDRLAPVLADASLSSVFARVPLPNTQTELVRLGAYRLPGDVVAAMDATAARKREEARHYRDLLAANDKPDELREIYVTGAIVADNEATAYAEHCSCVYAAVVYAAPAVLRMIEDRPETRAVDPITELQRLDRTVFLPPLPEQTTLAGPMIEVPASAAASPRPS
ncbi:hypothetical protein KZZ52_50490 [Dactylosporangium sp. AC04546]|uniref:hypothetical protein n=1 Tax=Dactylosporangium sp. AC04546 TaxID=2862460 RepID=UPI001EDCC606|nr:hypothetical protein [Dactylosporangium sp. AC04546]WVK82103.1 hypothetical protein KZZ52_50490 [Dactylosporangium sp. AC04546]